MICAAAWSQANGGSVGRDVSDTAAAQHVSDPATAQHGSDTGAAQHVSDSAGAQHVSDTGAAQHVSDTATVQRVFNSAVAHRASNTNVAHRVPNTGVAYRVADAGAPNSVPAHFVADTDSAHFRYYGRWEHVHHMRDGRMFGSSSRTASPASSVTFFFNGTQARIYGVRGPGGGRGVLTIDGDHYFDVDFYAPAKLPQVVIYSTPMLKKGSHFLVITPEAYPRTPHQHSSYINISGASVQ